MNDFSSKFSRVYYFIVVKIFGLSIRGLFNFPLLSLV